MKQLQRPICDALGAVERVRQLELIRDEKDAISRAFSEEKIRCYELMDQQRCADERIKELEIDVTNLKVANMRLIESERIVMGEMAQVKDRNAALMSENESMRGRISAQEDAIAVAQHLKEQTDRMIVDYEQVKNDLGYHGKRTEELQKDLTVNVAGRRHAEE